MYFALRAPPSARKQQWHGSKKDSHGYDDTPERKHDNVDGVYGTNTESAFSVTLPSLCVRDDVKCTAEQSGEP